MKAFIQEDGQGVKLKEDFDKIVQRLVLNICEYSKIITNEYLYKHLSKAVVERLRNHTDREVVAQKEAVLV